MKVIKIGKSKLRRPKHAAYAHYYHVTDWLLLSSKQHESKWISSKAEGNYNFLETLQQMYGFKSFQEAKQYLINCLSTDISEAQSSLKKVKKLKGKK